MNAAVLAITEHRRSLPVLLLLGIALRLLALNHPLVDAHLFRQTQTALITRGMIEEPGWHVGAVATWRGDLPARLVLELPVYNYLVMPVYHVTGNLDMSGKLVSVFFWALSFGMLQRIWRRCLTVRQAFWANLLFVGAPLSVFFGQAFMPEMLIQFLAFSLLVALLRYQEQPGPGRFAIAAAVGTTGMLVKAPEIAHLALIAAVIVFRQDGFRAWRRPVYWLAAIVPLLLLKAWGHVMDSANGQYFPEWTSKGVLSGFVGSWQSHVAPFGYVRIALYLICFVVMPAGLPVALAGLWRLWRARPWGFPMWWVWSIVFYFVLWCGPVARGQSYYNLPALGVCAMLFGLGMDWLLQRLRPASRSAAVAVAVTGLLIAFCAGGSWYLFRPDRVVLESTRWIREHSQTDDLILVRVNHRGDMGDYPALSAFPYYAGRRFWVYSSGVPPTERERALATSRLALVTLPPRKTSWLEWWRQHLKRETVQLEDPLSPLLVRGGFRLIHTNSDFVVYSR